ncbi:MAG: SpoIIE family protein phosphatase [bacterium]|nr:SpoIIE family protein phosphatase [bacterium]
MSKRKKIKLAVLFISLLTVILVLLFVALSNISLSSVAKLGQKAINIDIENSKKISTTFFKEIADRSAREYSNKFDEITGFTAIFAKQVKSELKFTSKLNSSNTAIKLTKYRDKKFYVNELNNVNAIYWGNTDNHIPDKILKRMNSIAGLIETYSGIFMRKLNVLSIWGVDYENFAIIYPHRFFYKKLNTINSIKKDYKELALIYANAKKRDKNITVFWTSSYIDVVTGRPVMSVCTPVYNDSGELITFVGFDLDFKKMVGELLSSDILRKEYLKTPAKNTDGKFNGFIFTIDRQGNILAMPNEYYKLFSLPRHTDSRMYNLTKNSKVKLNSSTNSFVKKLSAKMLKSDSGLDLLKLKGQDFIVAYSSINSTGWILGFVMNQDSLVRMNSKTKTEIHKTEEKMQIHLGLISLLFLILSILFAIIFFNNFFLKPINRIRHGIKKMGHGDFNINLKECEVFEISELASAFNYLGEELNTYMDNLKKELKIRQAYETEINIAADLQKSILPKVTTEFQNDSFKLFATLKAAKDVSGDFYDFFYLSENKIALLVADVSGKGIQAALFMSMSKALLKSYCFSEPDNPAKVLEKTNNYLCNDNEYKMFVTVFLAYYDCNTGKLTYANAGHHSSILVSSEGKYDNFGLLDGVILGFFPDIKFNSDSKLLKKDDLVVMYTDGIFEAVSPINKEYGEERLMELIVKNHNLEVDKICSAIIDDLEVFEEGSRFDDVTLLAFKKLE